MKIVIVSDTHGMHESLGVLEGDVLIHCGDGCHGSTEDEVEALDDWLGRQQFDRVLCTGGNHDFAMEERHGRGLPVVRNGLFLVDRAHEHRGVKFYGAPWTPELTQWAFYLDDEALADRWAQIPSDTDVLVTHTPPQGILDRSRSGRSCGCPALRRRVTQIRPTLHCFGHIHASAGEIDVDKTTFVNASMVQGDYAFTGRPHVFELS